MKAALRVEWWKIRRSPVVVVSTALMTLLLPLLGLGLYWVARNGGTGSLADKAAGLLVGEGWVGYLGLVDQTAAAALFLGAGVVVAWTFGREHADRTFPSLFGLTIPRETIAAAKFVVLVAWLVALAALVSLMALALGLVGGVEPVEGPVVLSGIWRLFGVCIGAGVLSLTMGFVASIGRGYLAAIGALVVIIAAAQVSVLFGTGGWFPFAVPGLLAVSGADGVPDLIPIQAALVPGVAAVAIWLTLRWWKNAEVV